jgi:hypothetical protein
MYTTKNGENIFVIDAHIALWDGSPPTSATSTGKNSSTVFTTTIK